jgi:GT2 family glycosyltransferase/tetratricopeptide (TPR) repeat protein
MRLAVATRSMSDFLYRASGDLLGLEGVCAGNGVRWERHRLTGTDNFGYFRELLRLDADWVINLDEDAFVLDPARLLGLVRALEAGGYAACGMPDGGVVPIRRHNPAACNAYFNVFDLRRVRPVWQDWDRVVAARHRPEYEGLVAPFARRSVFAFDHFERYYGAFFALLGAGEHILYLDAEEWQDGITTLLKDAAGEPLLLHCWYSRYWDTSHHTRLRYREAIDYARRAQGRDAYPWATLENPAPPADSDQTRRGGTVTMPVTPSAAPSDPTVRAVLECVPRSARRILAAGDSTDGLDEALKARQSAELRRRSIDADAGAAPETPADCVVCLDELTCTRDPGQWLRRARSWLSPGGCLVASVPNARHHAALGTLLQGRWQPDPVGPSRHRPLRFFTRRETEKLFYRAGFTIRRLEGLPGPGHDDWVQRGRPPEVRVGSLHLGGLAPAEAEEFYLARYLVEAVPAEAPDRGLTSIILITHNQLSYTRLCVESIRQVTDQPYELICVDNASDDGTPDYLERQPNARVIRNPDNRGFPAAVNQGIRAASDRQVLLLNNDTVVTTGWLDRLLHALHSDDRVGLVGPCSNFVSGGQQVAVRYDDLAQLDGFAWDWGKAHHRVLEDTDRLVGFCLLIRREVIDRVGLLDERFGVGCFEDDDYCRRARQAGYRAVIARDAFVHHFGGRTFVGSGVDFAALMRKNEQLFRAKWEQDRPPEKAAAPAASGQRAYRVRVAPGGGLLLGQAGVESSLCMIVRDNARTIGPCLESIREVVDDLVVVDTGSQDETPAIARRLGARVFHFPWCDSFSAARNESLRHARGKWVFWMDSDDTIDAANAGKLRALIRQDTPANLLGYVVSVHCPGPGDEADVTVVQHVKLFRNFPQLRFEGRIHEQIIPAIRALGGDIGWTDLFVVHSGYDHGPEAQKRKLERDLRLLHLEVEERPEHPFTLFNLAMTYTDCGRYEDGLRYARQCLARSPEGSSHLRKAYAYLVSCHDKLGQSAEAWQACEEGLRKFPLDDELRFRKGVLLHGRGRLQEAVQTYLDLLQTREEPHFSSVVAGIAGHLARHNLALVYRDLGDLAGEEEQWRLAVEEQPRYRPAWRGLGDVLVRRRQDAAARVVAERLLADGRLRGEGRVLLGALAAARGDHEAARRELERGVAECPDDPEPRQALCQLLFEQGQPAEAERALRELVRRCPDNASAHHNLGTVCLRLRRPEAAVEAYRQALVHRPDWAETHLHLGYALRECGRLEEAVAAWEAAVRLEPGNRAASAELEQARRAGRR